MGNEVGAYKDCSLTKAYETSSSPFAVYAGNTKDGTDVSVFVYSEDDCGSDMVENAVKYLKTLRHPGIVKLLGIDKSQDETWLITEHVKPLEVIIDSMSQEEICAGLYDVIQVMTFIHERAHLCHNSLSVSSIFVAEGGAWKVAGLECMCTFDQATSSQLSGVSKWRPQICIAPEEKKGYKLNTDLGHARDAFAFGHLAEQLLELMSSTDLQAKTFELRVQDECLSEDPRQRPHFSSFLDDQLFKSDFVRILNFLRTLTVQSETEKEEFFRHLVAKLFQLPPSLVASRLARPLLARFVLLEKSAVDYLLPHLLTPFQGTERTSTFSEGEINPVLPTPLFQQYVIPELFKIFHVRDAHIRIVLLRHFKQYCNLFDPRSVKTVLLPQVLLGLRDVNDELGELSLRALADLVPVLGGDAVISLHRSKLFTSGTPNFKKPSITSVTANGVPTSSPVKTANIKTVERSSNEDFAREQERERRREEARKRAEERRVKREQRKKQPLKAQIIEDEAPVVKTIESDDGGPIDINKAKANWTEGDDVKKEISQLEELSQNSNSDEPEDKFNDSFDRTESDIDFEIEQELDSMESTLPKDKLRKISQIDSNSSCDSKTDLAPDVKIDWSDISTSPPPVQSIDKVSKKGVLKLKSPLKTKISPPPSESTALNSTENDNKLSTAHDSASFRNRKQSNEMDEWGSSWDDVKAPPKSPPTPKSPQSPAAQKSHKCLTKKSKINRRTGPPRIQDNLGADYDIKCLDVKTFKGVGTKIEEVDFFADMVPSVNTKSHNLFNMLADAAKSTNNSEKEESSSKSSLSFAMKDTSETDAAGGWENEDFEW